MSKLEDVVKSLVKPKAGGGAEADRDRLVFGLEEYSSAQRQRGIMIGILLLALLAAPTILILINVSVAYLPYLLGGSGLFAAGTVKMMLNSFQEVSRAHTLMIVTQGLSSSDAKEVLVTWLKGRE